MTNISHLTNSEYLYCDLCDVNRKQNRDESTACDHPRNGYCAIFRLRAIMDIAAIKAHIKQDQYDLQEQDLKNIKNNGQSNNE